MKLSKPKICAAIVSDDAEMIKKAAPYADLYEVRIDLIGQGWPELVKQLDKPWIACNRRAAEGGAWRRGEAARVSELLKALEAGADIIDIELASDNLGEIIGKIKTGAKCLVSHHDLNGTPPLAEMKGIINRQMEAGADICKLVTTARRQADNLEVLRLIREYPENNITAFAMGAAGNISRVLCPLAGGYFTYAAAAAGAESAPGQLTAREMKDLYGTLHNGK